MSYDPLESILVVFQNPAPGRLIEYDDWYTNVHIRDAMRLDGAIATQRFITGEQQLVLGGNRVDPGYFAHTIYEWESAAKSVAGHSERACTPRMQITRDCDFARLRDYFYRPVHLSHGWTREAGFRRGDQMLTAMIAPRVGDEAGFAEWFVGQHAPATLALPGIGSVGLFSLHEEQSLPNPCPFPFVAVYGLTDRPAALAAWGDRHDARAPDDLHARAHLVEATAWKPRIARLRAEDAVNPPPMAAAEEARARALYAGHYFTGEELAPLLHAG